MYKYTRVACVYCLTDIVVSFIVLLLAVVVVMTVGVLHKSFVYLFVICVSGLTLCQYVCMSLCMCSLTSDCVDGIIYPCSCVCTYMQNLSARCVQIGVYMHLYLSLCAH